MDDLHARHVDWDELVNLPEDNVDEPDPELKVFNRFGPCATIGCACEDQEPVNVAGRCYPCHYDS